MLASSSSSSLHPRRELKMRPGISLNDPHPLAPVAATVEAIPPAVHTAPWRSPVPYLFGGLASMLGLITFALLVLACSYWKLAGYLERVDSDEHMSETAGSGGLGKAVDEAQDKQATALEERFVVIMAGDEKKIFLANPIRSRASTFSGGGGDEQPSAAAKIGENESDGGGETVTENCAVNVSGGDSTHNHI
ncbi:hypothetical protein KFK09_026735 [Dendrobium nobile]|uniref:Uncharacterized protein n=1 Tax=Dendrobium nobile TaxID=94219 RepID=A0A8T3A9J1_DENNO|nr:hypothetical protein KFK09_026735 [Dendrobium nobile]